MEIVRTNNGLMLRREGEEFTLTSAEIYELQSHFRKLDWRSSIEERIDMDEEYLDFSKMSREEFVEECLAEAEEKWEYYFEFGEETLNDIVYEKAQELEIWRDEE